MAGASEILALQVAVEGFKKFQDVMGDMDGSIDETGKKWGGLGDILSTVGKVGLAAVAAGAVVAVGAVAGLAKGIVDLTLQAMPVEGLAAAFEGLTADMTGGSQAMLAALQESSAGMIANRDLMESFNKAASLVSVDFAQKLPDAMQYLGKVSAATGTDLDFLLDSLVTGVGRLSPMILDNLAIQVDATAANEAYALSVGKSVDELTKAEQQTALMNQVLEKLEENTTDLPDTTDMAATSMAAMQATVQNLKDDIGVAFLPVLKELLTMFGELWQQHGPMIIEWAQTLAGWLQDNLIPAVGAVVNIFSSLIAGLSGGGLEGALAYLGDFPWEDIFPAPLADRIYEIIEWLQDNLPKAIDKTSAFFTEVLIPILQDVWAFIQENVVPILQEVWVWLMENLPIAIEEVKKFIDKTLLPALRDAWDYFKVNIIPILEETARVAEYVLGEAVRILADLWENFLLPALTLVWEFIQDPFIPLLTALWELIDTSLNKTVEILIALLENHLLPALGDVWEFLDKYVMPILKDLADVILPALALGFEIVTGWVRDLIDFFKRLGDIIDSIELPPWLEPGSPPPLALALGDIAAQMRQLTNIEIPRLATEFTVLHRVAQPALAAVGGNYSNTYAPQYNLTTQSMTQPGALRLEFQAMEAMATR